MKKFLKGIAAALTLALVLGLSVYGVQQIPDTFSCYEDEEPAVDFYYTLDADSETLADQGDGNYTAKVKLFGFLPIKTAEVRRISRKQLIPLGTPFGVKLYTQGVIVVDAEEGSPGVEAGIQVGDIILTYNGVEITSNAELKEQVNQCNGMPQKVRILRNQRARTLEVLPVKGEDGYSVGLWVRDSAAGLGTLTYYDPQTQTVAGLGHSISDVDTGLTMPVSSGTMVEATVTGVRVGQKGTPGELLGTLKENELGTVTENCQAGLFGKATAEYTGVSYPIALRNEIKTGEAQILCTISGDIPELYTISITKINNNLEEYKNLCITVTDERLLAKTGGIVQGMSGSPLIQNGKLIGAVTHVLVDDPTKGYAIFAENMLETAQSVAENNKLKDVS